MYFIIFYILVILFDFIYLFAHITYHYHIHRITSPTPWLIHKKVMTHSSSSSTSSSIEDPSSSLSSDFSRSLNLSELTPLSPEVIQRQATVNIGTIGHVAHGKSTVVKAISGVQTVRFKNELERNITIKLGYANAKVYFFIFFYIW